MAIDTNLDGYKETQLGLIPEDWTLARLEDVVNGTRTRDPRKKPKERFLYIDVSSVSNDTFRVTGWKELQGMKAPSRARKVVKAGDTIFATVRPYLKNIAQVPPELDDQVCSTGFCVLSANTDHLYPDFLYFSVITDAFVSRVVAKQRGSSYPAVTDVAVLAESILLPSLNEQKRIAYVLSTIQMAIEAQERVVSAARELKRSLMHRLFTYGPYRDECPTKQAEVGEIPEHWEVIRFGDVVEIASGQVDPRETPYAGMPHVGPENIEEATGRLLLPLQTAEELRLKSGKYLFAVDDVVYSKIRPYLRKVALPNFVGICSADMYPLRPKDSRLDKHYLYHFLLTEKFSSQAVSYQSRTGIPKINRIQLNSTYFLLPPLNEQQRIAESLSAIDSRIETDVKRKFALSAIFKSMLHYLMTGRIRVNNLESAVFGVIERTTA